MKIGIIGAMEVEVDYLKAQMKDRVTTKIADMAFCEGHLGGVSVVVVRSGVGKVNAAACMQVLATRFGVDGVINTGVAGSLDGRLDVGDILVSTDAVYYDVDVTVFGYRLGEVPEMGIYNFRADERLRAAAVAAVAAAAPEVSCIEGRVASGDRFVRDSQTKASIRKTSGASCCEMEGCAIAQVAWLNHVPFVIVRAISDKADGSDIDDYPTFEKVAARHCAQIVEHMLATMGS